MAGNRTVAGAEGWAVGGAGRVLQTTHDNSTNNQSVQDRYYTLKNIILDIILKFVLQSVWCGCSAGQLYTRTPGIIL